MLAIFTNPAYDFIGKRRWAYAVSVAVMLLGVGSMFVKGGLQYDIDFTGGTLVEVRLAQPVPIGMIRSRLTPAGLGDSILQVFEDPRDVLIRTHLSPPNPTELSRRILSALEVDGVWSSWGPRLELSYVDDDLRNLQRRSTFRAVRSFRILVCSSVRRVKSPLHSRAASKARFDPCQPGASRVGEAGGTEVSGGKRRDHPQCSARARTGATSSVARASNRGHRRRLIRPPRSSGGVDGCVARAGSRPAGGR